MKVNFIFLKTHVGKEEGKQRPIDIDIMRLIVEFKLIAEIKQHLIHSIYSFTFH